eukprot:TRINITY_DN784_c0_g2_i2.p1 TRINITY_DN784_c0_g2~~TRINITY_DN784_c0_g2_i2.p1  ORF type:complete len:183 (-),score=59.30 TRINITY_DN784_c0_g2_i2:49-597(-)
MLGMLMAGMEGSPISRLVLNDIGPWCPKEDIATLKHLVELPEFPSLDAVVQFMREFSAGFGKLPQAVLQDMAAFQTRKDPSTGRYVMNYDPVVADLIRYHKEDTNMWDVFDKITCPMLVLRGALSVILRPATLDEMARRVAARVGAGVAPMRMVVVPGVGHAPPLATPCELDPIVEFLAPPP